MADLSNKSFAELAELETALAQAKQNIRRRYRLAVRGLSDEKEGYSIATAVQMFTGLCLIEARELARMGYMGEKMIDLEQYKLLTSIRGIELICLG